jgi:hypothetical protein
MPEFTVEVRTTGTEIFTVNAKSREDIDLALLDQHGADDFWEDERWISHIEPSGY